MTYLPVTDEEWNYLQRRFAALERRPGMRQLFNNSLMDSPYDDSMRRQFRREIFENVRELASPRAAYQNPYFELTWFRFTKIDPSLLLNLAHNRSVLYDAYYNRDETERRRDQRRAEWRRISELGPGSEVMETITDGEVLEASE